MKTGKIIQLFVHQDLLLCLTENGMIFSFDPRNLTYEYLSEGIPQ